MASRLTDVHSIYEKHSVHREWPHLGNVTCQPKCTKKIPFNWWKKQPSKVINRKFCSHPPWSPYIYIALELKGFLCIGYIPKSRAFLTMKLNFVVKVRILISRYPYLGKCSTLAFIENALLLFFRVFMNFFFDKRIW